MSSRKPSVPSYRLHKPSGQAVVTVPLANGKRKDIYLGEYNTDVSRREYARVVAELATAPEAGASTGATSTSGQRFGDVTIDEVLLAFWHHAEQHYRRPDGTPTNSLVEYRCVILPLRELYGHTIARNFGPLALKAVRQRMIDSGNCRPVINSRIGKLRRIFKWATSEELIPVTVYQALDTVPGLQKGRTAVREPEPIGPADPATVAATLPFLPPVVRVMVELLRLTGMRPGEVALTLGEVDRSGELWLYRPTAHKTAHRGRGRVVPFGPRARALLTEYLIGGKPPPTDFTNLDLTDETARLVAADAYQEAGRDRDAALLRDLGRPVVMVAGCIVDPLARVFNPREAREEKFRTMRAKRKSKVTPSQQNRRKVKPKRVPAATYTSHALSVAVRRAAAKACVPHWHPNQLRHLFATTVRKAHGLEAAQVLLGHAKADITQTYAERDLALAASVAGKLG